MIITTADTTNCATETQVGTRQLTEWDGNAALFATTENLATQFMFGLLERLAENIIQGIIFIDKSVEGFSPGQDDEARTVKADIHFRRPIESGRVLERSLQRWKITMRTKR